MKYHLIFKEGENFLHLDYTAFQEEAMYEQIENFIRQKRIFILIKGKELMHSANF
jgi:hypothetical protein